MQSFLMFLENYKETPEMRGEYWIDDNGQILEANEYSEQNHESHVITLMQSMIADKLGIYNEDWEEVKKELAEKVYDKTIEELEKARSQAESHQDHVKLRTVEQEIEQVQEKWNDEDLIPFIEKGLKNHNVSNQEYQVAEGVGDVRDYAMEYWGWKRVDDHNIETWTLTPNDIDTILSGIYEITQEENIGNLEVYIYIHSNRSSHDLTVEQLEEMIRPKQPVVPVNHPNYSFEDPILKIKQIARDRNNANINLQNKAYKNYQTYQDLNLMNPYYASKKFPFADWTFRNHGIIIS